METKNGILIQIVVYMIILSIDMVVEGVRWRV